MPSPATTPRGTGLGDVVCPLDPLPLPLLLFIMRPRRVKCTECECECERGGKGVEEEEEAADAGDGAVCACDTDREETCEMNRRFAPPADAAGWTGGGEGDEALECSRAGDASRPLPPPASTDAAGCSPNNDTD